MGAFPTSTLTWVLFPLLAIVLGGGRSTIISTAITPPPPAPLLRALTRLLRPLVRLLIRSGLTFPILADLLRTLYVEVAAADLPEQARTDSRLSLLTGIHRKELRRQRVQEGGSREPEVVTLNSQVIGRWLGDPAYTAPDRAPLKLRRTGPAPSFEALVASVTRDMRSRAVLDEWLAKGIAALDAEGFVHLHVAAFLPQEDTEARLFYFARNVHDHVAAAAANIVTSGAPPFLERSAHYDKLGVDAAAAVVRHARDAATKVLLDVNRAALAIADQDEAANPGPRRTQRVNFGVYVYLEDEPDAA